MLRIGLTIIVWMFIALVAVVVIGSIVQSMQ